MSETEPHVDVPDGMEKDELRDVTPVKWDDRSGRETRTEFRFNRTYVDELDEFDCGIPEVDTEVIGDSLVWHYNGKCRVVITRGRVLAPASASRKERERQAYFALSRLDSKGLVSRWRKT